MQWTVNGVDDANHAPETCVAQGVDVTRHAGEPVVLTPRVSDPDGDTVTARWRQYREAGTYPDAVDVQNTGAGAARLRVPDDAEPGQTIHLILETTDDGTPELTSYQRVVLTVAGGQEAVGTESLGSCTAPS